jgi:hypothetical protein
VQWLAISIVLSVVLTVVLNLLLRAFPHAGERAARRLSELAAPPPNDRTDSTGNRDDSGVRVIVPWKAMLIGSLILTVAINVLIRLF